MPNEAISLYETGSLNITNWFVSVITPVANSSSITILTGCVCILYFLSVWSASRVLRALVHNEGSWISLNGILSTKLEGYVGT